MEWKPKLRISVDGFENEERRREKKYQEFKMREKTVYTDLYTMGAFMQTSQR